MTCVVCGEQIPEGRQVCPACEGKTATLTIVLPKSCWDCSLSYVDGRDVVCCPTDKAVSDVTLHDRRADFCPLAVGF